MFNYNEPYVPEGRIKPNMFIGAIGAGVSAIGGIAAQFGPPSASAAAQIESARASAGEQRAQTGRRDQLFGDITKRISDLGSTFQPVKEAGATATRSVADSLRGSPQAQTFEQLQARAAPIAQAQVAAAQQANQGANLDALRRLNAGTPGSVGQQNALQFQAQQDLQNTLAALQQQQQVTQGIQNQRSAEQNIASQRANIAALLPSVAASGIQPEQSSFIDLARTGFA